MDTSVLLTAIIINASLGYVIGLRNNRAVHGAVLGGCFSILGWIIVLMLPPNNPKCPVCGGYAISLKPICKNCGCKLTWVSKDTVYTKK